MRVMCDIQYQPRSVADNLKTPGQNRILNTVADGLFAHRQPACAQCRRAVAALGCGTCGRGRFSSVPAHRDSASRCSEPHTASPHPGAAGERPSLSPRRQWCAAYPARQPPRAYSCGKYRPSHGQYFRDRGRASRYDPGNAGDHRHIGIHHIGGIQTPAEAHFQNHHVQLRLFKQPQRRQSAVFEIG